MKERKLVVAEQFYSIQGEGQTAGTPAVFLRLAGCNLLCNNPKGWRCDTIEVWQKGIAYEYHDVLDKECTYALHKGAHLVITGGEPMLQQEKIVEYLYWISSTHRIRPKVEIETNGTVIPNNDMRALIDYWNISPKLPNSGEPWRKRVIPAALAEYKYLSEWRNIGYKFVVANQDDVTIMIEEYAGLVNWEKVWLMPAGATQEELSKVRPVVAELCKQFHYKYSERLHIGIWDKKTGV